VAISSDSIKIQWFEGPRFPTDALPVHRYSDRLEKWKSELL
jgi:hypothetical protein